jgi:phosphate transport system substrate-binding protein
MAVTAAAAIVLTAGALTVAWPRKAPASETISLINGAAAQAYPIINYEYAVVKASQPSATRAQDLRAFLTWAVTSGTAQLAKVHFQPLPPSVITLSHAQIARIKG